MKFITLYEKKVIARMCRDRFSQAAIAKAVGTSQGAVSKILARARRNDPTLPKRCRGKKREETGRRPKSITASQMEAELEYL
jgi:predicted transcriptional regulator